MIRVVVFDFDGTLADTNTIKEDCLHRTVAGLPGGPAALAEARKIGGDRYMLFAEVARRLSCTDAVQTLRGQTRAMVDAYSNCCMRGIVAAADRRGAREAINGLRCRGLRLYVLSATPDRHLREALRRRGLLSRLSGFLGSSVTKEQGLLKIMARERVSRAAMLLVGDSADDQRAARTVGIKFAVVTAENRVHGQGRFAMRDLRPLVPLIDNLNARRAPHAK